MFEMFVFLCFCTKTVPVWDMATALRVAAVTFTRSALKLQQNEIVLGLEIFVVFNGTRHRKSTLTSQY